MKEVSTSFLRDNSSKDLIYLLNNTKTDYIHYDVMDGKFVNNRFLTVKELKETLEISTKKNDIHFMVCDPLKYIEEISTYNIDYITIHYEIDNLEEVIDRVKSLGIKVGVALKPKTDISEIYSLLDEIDLVLIMSVEPGYSGQEFIKESKDKIDNLKEEINRRNLNIKIEVDGGINEEVLPLVSNTDIVVSSSYIFKDFDNIERIKNS